MKVWIIHGFDMDSYEAGWLQEIHLREETAILRAKFLNDEELRNEQSYRYSVREHDVIE